MTNNIEFELQRVGLDEREAKIYLAALELGPSPVQKIAQRARIPRATTYLVLDDLRNKGFVTTYGEDKKNLFVAESPERLSTLIEEKEAEVQRQKETVANIIPELIARGQFEQGERPLVRYYEGKDAVKSWLRDMLSGRGGEEILNIFHHDRAEKVLNEIGFPFEKVLEWRNKHRIKARVIYTADNGPFEEYSDTSKAKFVPVNKYPFEADLAIRGNRVFIAPYSVPLRGVVIEDKAIANSIRLVFEALWDKLA